MWNRLLNRSNRHTDNHIFMHGAPLVSPAIKCNFILKHENQTFQKSSLLKIIFDEHTYIFLYFNKFTFHIGAKDKNHCHQRYLSGTNVIKYVGVVMIPFLSMQSFQLG